MVELNSLFWFLNILLLLCYKYEPRSKQIFHPLFSKHDNSIHDNITVILLYLFNFDALLLHVYQSLHLYHFICTSHRACL